MSELIPVELNEVTAAEVFSGAKLDELLASIKAETTSLVPNVDTLKGRKEISALAHKVAKSKTYLDGLGKELVKGWKDQAKVVDNDRKRAREFLDDLKAEVRKPLTDWETAEETRVARHEELLASIVSDGQQAIDCWMDIPIQQLIDRRSDIVDISTGNSWEEYQADAINAQDKTVAQLTDAIEKRQKYDAEQAELEELRKQKAEQEQKDRDEALRREGEEKTKHEAEAAIQAGIDAKENAERRAKEADERAVRDTEAAAQRERDRIEAERKADEEAAKKREANLQYRGKINRAAVAELVKLNLTESKAKDVVKAIALGKIPAVEIRY